MLATIIDRLVVNDDLLGQPPPTREEVSGPSWPFVGDKWKHWRSGCQLSRPRSSS
jgi:hypothetical protein